jgi:predicted transcriptional regulator
MRKVAIVRIMDYDYDYDCGNDVRSLISSKITDFVEIDENTYKLLKEGEAKYQYLVIEQIQNKEQFILNTVEDYKNFLEKERMRLEEEKKQKELNALMRKAKKQAQTLEQERILFESLKNKFEGAKKRL